MAEDQQFHFPAQGRTVPVLIFTMHGELLGVLDMVQHDVWDRRCAKREPSWLIGKKSMPLRFTFLAG
jgi:hypothetical protein